MELLKFTNNNGIFHFYLCGKLVATNSGEEIISYKELSSLIAENLHSLKQKGVALGTSKENPYAFFPIQDLTSRYNLAIERVGETTNFFNYPTEDYDYFDDSLSSLISLEEFEEILKEI